MQVVGIATLRACDQDLVLQGGDLVIPRRCPIWMPQGLPHMSSAIFPDADCFLPERWLEPDAELMPAVGGHLQYTCLSPNNFGECNSMHIAVPCLH